MCSDAPVDTVQSWPNFLPKNVYAVASAECCVSEQFYAGGQFRKVIASFTFSCDSTFALRTRISRDRVSDAVYLPPRVGKVFFGLCLPFILLNIGICTGNRVEKTQQASNCLKSIQL